MIYNFLSYLSKLNFSRFSIFHQIFTSPCQVLLALGISAGCISEDWWTWYYKICLPWSIKNKSMQWVIFCHKLHSLGFFPTLCLDKCINCKVKIICNSLVYYVMTYMVSFCKWFSVKILNKWHAIQLTKCLFDWQIPISCLRISLFLYPHTCCRSSYILPWSIRMSVNFCQISQLVYVRLIWYLVWEW